VLLQECSTSLWSWAFSIFWRYVGRSCLVLVFPGSGSVPAGVLRTVTYCRTTGSSCMTLALHALYAEY
jgi:hypothetical protein